MTAFSPLELLDAIHGMPKATMIVLCGRIVKRNRGVSVVSADMIILHEGRLHKSWPML